MFRYLFLLIGFFSTYTYAITPERLNFVYQELVEPYATAECRHQQSNVYDYDVECMVRGRSIKYFAHVAVTFYPKTKWGISSYEILYWVTDTTNPKKYQNSSSTIWVHNSSPDNKIRVLEAEQGIENDRAGLKLTYFSE